MLATQVNFAHLLRSQGDKYYRMMSKNANYIIVMKKPRDVSHIRILASQMGMDLKLLLLAYKDATKNSYRKNVRCSKFV